MDSTPLARLETLDGYRQHFMDAALWRPCVTGVCRAHGWTCERVRPGVAGTFPTFLVDEARVVKFFGPLFDGATCLKVEYEAAQRMAAVPEVPIARLLAEGTLAGTAGWGYLVFEFVEGVSIGEVYAQVGFEDRLALARWLGGWMRRMHAVEVRGETALPSLGLERMSGWFSLRWPEDRQKWPVRLAAGVREYLQENAAFIQSGDGCFIHADLTLDHVLGMLEDGRWTTRAVIDFGDAMRGNLYYELAALHLDLFDCDRRLLAAFLEGYGLDPDPDFARKAMATTLLHQFDVYGHLFAWKPELGKARTLEELARWLWEV